MCERVAPRSVRFPKQRDPPTLVVYGFYETGASLLQTIAFIFSQSWASRRQVDRGEYDAILSPSLWSATTGGEAVCPQCRLGRSFDCDTREVYPAVRADTRSSWRSTLGVVLSALTSASLSSYVLPRLTCSSVTVTGRVGALFYYLDVLPCWRVSRADLSEFPPFIGSGE